MTDSAFASALMRGYTGPFFMVCAYLASFFAQNVSQMTTNSIVPTLSLKATIAHSQMVTISCMIRGKDRQPEP